MDFEHAHPLATFAVSLLAFLVLAGSVMWPFSWKRLGDSFPFILTVAIFPLGYAMMILPEAFPGLFESLLGHSIYSHRFETDWQWLNRWEMGVAPIIRWALVLGAIGGLINLVRGRDRIINSLALAVGILLYYLAIHVGI
jgi:lipid-A-disaccharide synthase-like uncharacterized protein